MTHQENKGGLRAKQVAVLFVSQDSRYFVERLAGGEWRLPLVNVYGVRDTVVNVVSSKAAHLGLTCNVGEVKRLQGFSDNGVSVGLVAVTVCWKRFWDREGAEMMTIEALKRANLHHSVHYAVAEYLRTSVALEPAPADYRGAFIHVNAA